jgi:hypothetical protein
MRESPPRVLCRVAIGSEHAHRERLEPSAIAFDPLMRSTGPSGRRGGAQGRYKVAWTDTTRVRGQFRPEMTLGAGQGQCSDCWADVVLGLTTLPLPRDGQRWSGEHLLYTLLQLLISHSEHLQLPIARCYLLLKRTLRFSDQGRRLDGDPFGQQFAQCRRQIGDRDLPRPSGLEAQVEILAARLAPRRESEAEAHQGMRDESLGVGQRQPAAPQCPFPHASHVTVAGEPDLPLLGEAQSEAALAVREHG